MEVWIGTEEQGSSKADMKVLEESAWDSDEIGC